MKKLLLFILLFVNCITPLYHGLPSVVDRVYRFRDNTCNYVVYTPALNWVVIKDAPCDCYTIGDTLHFVKK